ncbi:GSCOCG00005876001-RA-CDS [Cotesia congregata]|nr:GSCOCG00005876001-RA-CDS [Cotesia congregata]
MKLTTLIPNFFNSTRSALVQEAKALLVELYTATPGNDSSLRIYWTNA